jgi:tRNA (cytidine/uridine-2'-O-)-methyltransferase
LAVGSESRGAPPALVERSVAVRIPIRAELRSLNVVTAAAMGLGEALRQLDLWPGPAAQSPAVAGSPVD